MQVTSFDQWMDTLSEALHKAKAIGMPEQEIAKAATELGSFLSKTIDPDIPENKLLKSLWDNGSADERLALANMVVKVVDKRGQH